MKAPRQLLTLTLATAVTGCAALALEPPPEQNAELRLDRGLSALDAGLYREAFDDLAWVYAHCSEHQAGSHALVALAGLELDARNRAARPEVGTELLGRAIQGPGVPTWLRPLAETTFLTALALGAPHPGTEETEDRERRAGDEAEPGDMAAAVDRAEGTPQRPTEPIPQPSPTFAAGTEAVHGCGPRVAVEDWIAPPLPTLPGPSMAALLSRSEAARDSLAARTDSLQRELAAVREQLQVTRAELERIRKTLRP